ncbi:MAG: pyridoxal-phosphate dependent enzyme [Chloroflexi bacterium]|nr:pyridoxal-phosphate dependent enzyme [Chloroflexota bacterium]
MTTIRCNACGEQASALAWRCTTCEGSLDLAGLPAFDPKLIQVDDYSLWRYAAMLPVQKRFSLGEGMTPLAPVELDGDSFLAKLDYLNPTGSYKDRGTTTLMNHIVGFDVPEVIDNSSGNAGASIAAYASLAGIRARIYVPSATAVESKKKLISLFGGAIVESRQPVADVYAAAQTVTYASHAWSPWFVLGQMTVAWETWEQMGGRAPDAVATPVGHGGLFLGFYRGFRALQEAGLIEAMPRMIAVQSSGVDPVVQAWEQGLESPPTVSASPSVADGILVDAPVRGPQILSALYQTEGCALRVDNESIRTAQRRMTGKGLIIEMTSAVVTAALPQIRQRTGGDATVVLAFTGNGLKNLA